MFPTNQTEQGTTQLIDERLEKECLLSWSDNVPSLRTRKWLLVWCTPVDKASTAFNSFLPLTSRTDRMSLSYVLQIYREPSSVYAKLAGYLVDGWFFLALW